MLANVFSAIHYDGPTVALRSNANKINGIAFHFSYSTCWCWPNVGPTFGIQRQLSANGKTVCQRWSNELMLSGTRTGIDHMKGVNMYMYHKFMLFSTKRHLRGVWLWYLKIPRVTLVTYCYGLAFAEMRLPLKKTNRVRVLVTIVTQCKLLPLTPEHRDCLTGLWCYNVQPSSVAVNFLMRGIIVQ